MERTPHGLFLVESLGNITRERIQNYLEYTQERKQRVTFIQIIPAPKNNIFSLSSIRYIKVIEAGLISKAKTELDALLEPFVAFPHDIRKKVLMGKTDEVVIEFIKREKIDYLYLIPESNLTGWGSILGSSEFRLLRSSPVPVLLVRTSSPITKIIAAIDLQTENEDNDRLNELILQNAAFMARVYGIDLEVVHFWTLYGESILSEVRGKMEENRLSVALKEEEVSRKEKMDKLEKYFVEIIEAEPIKYKFRLIKGDPVVGLPNLVNEHDDYMIVLGTIGRKGMAGFIMGNTAETIIHRVSCSIMAFKPDSAGLPMSS